MEYFIPVFCPLKMFSILNLKNIIYVLAIYIAVAHGQTLPTPVSTRNVPSVMGHFSNPTSTSLVRRGLGSCQDNCAAWLDGEALRTKVDFTNHCSSFLSTAVGPTLVKYGPIHLSFHCPRPSGTFNNKTSTYNIQSHNHNDHHDI
jgi:hypothetical protein